MIHFARIAHCGSQNLCVECGVASIILEMAALLLMLLELKLVVANVVPSATLLAPMVADGAPSTTLSLRWPKPVG